MSLPKIRNLFADESVDPNEAMTLTHLDIQLRKAYDALRMAQDAGQELLPRQGALALVLHDIEELVAMTAPRLAHIQHSLHQAVRPQERGE
jgi:hypothetical protein